MAADHACAAAGLTVPGAVARPPAVARGPSPPRSTVKAGRRMTPDQVRPAVGDAEGSRAPGWPGGDPSRRRHLAPRVVRTCRPVGMVGEADRHAGRVTVDRNAVAAHSMIVARLAVTHPGPRRGQARTAARSSIATDAGAVGVPRGLGRCTRWVAEAPVSRSSGAAPG